MTERYSCARCYVLERALDDVSVVAVRRWRVLLNIQGLLRSCFPNDAESNAIILECLRLIDAEENK